GTQVRQVTAAAKVLLLRAQEFHQDPRLSARQLVERITPCRQMNEQDLVLDAARGGCQHFGRDTPHTAVQTPRPVHRNRPRHRTTTLCLKLEAKRSLNGRIRLKLVRKLDVPLTWAEGGSRVARQVRE